MWNIFFYQRQQRCVGTFITASLTEKGPCKKYWPCNLQLAFGNLQEKQWGPLQRLYIRNHFDQTSLREDSSLLFCFLLDFTLFYVKGFWTVGFQEFGGHLIREHSNDLAVQLPLGSGQQWQLGKDMSVCFSVDMVNVRQMWREAHQSGAEIVVTLTFPETFRTSPTF